MSLFFHRLFGFAATTFVLSLYNVSARGVVAPNAVVGLAVGYGGLAQFVAGIWEFAAGNTFGATAFCSYGGFWWSYAALLIPWFGVSDAYAKAGATAEAGTEMMANAIGLYLVAWFIFTFIMVSDLSPRSNLFLSSSLIIYLLFTSLPQRWLLLSEVHLDWFSSSFSWISPFSFSLLPNLLVMLLFKRLVVPLESLRLPLLGMLELLVY